MRIRGFVLFASGVFFMALTLPVRIAISATLLSADTAAEVVGIRGTTIREGDVSGDLINKSRGLVRDVQLQITYTWLWNDEFHPGKDDPGRTVYYTVEKEIPPGLSVGFAYKPSPPLPSRTDGVFITTVSVAGYSQVWP
jgi:hypothetical protein